MISTDINFAAQILQNGGLIGLPTETVYGLAANIYNKEAIQKIYELKQRPLKNPLIVHIKSINELPKVALNIPKAAYKLAELYWPGPLTLLLPKHPSVPSWVNAGKNTVAVRVPNHPMALALLEKIDFPLAAPSANPFTCISPTQATHVQQYFQETIGLVLDGGSCQAGLESTIVGFQNDVTTIYRHGSISIETIEKIVGKVNVVNEDKSIQSPGMHAVHYAPKTPLLITTNIAETIASNAHINFGVITLASPKPESTCTFVHEALSPNKKLEEAAQNLYATLHKFDALGLDLIIAELAPDIELGRSINDRLKRAAQKFNTPFKT
jgi:L-threonylcarbamoyladenylate synthase